jgi:hypothetical protein
MTKGIILSFLFALSSATTCLFSQTPSMQGPSDLELLSQINDVLDKTILTASQDQMDSLIQAICTGKLAEFDGGWRALYLIKTKAEKKIAYYQARVKNKKHRVRSLRVGAGCLAASLLMGALSYVSYQHYYAPTQADAQLSAQALIDSFPTTADGTRCLPDTSSELLKACDQVIARRMLALDSLNPAVGCGLWSVISGFAGACAIYDYFKPRDKEYLKQWSLLKARIDHALGGSATA